MVYDASESKERAWIWDLAETNDGNPVVVYSRFPSDSSHVYYYGIFANGQWQMTNLRRRIVFVSLCDLCVLRGEQKLLAAPAPRFVAAPSRIRRSGGFPDIGTGTPLACT